jgi:hypothetical protein
MFYLFLPKTEEVLEQEFPNREIAKLNAMLYALEHKEDVAVIKIVGSTELLPPDAVEVSHKNIYLDNLGIA